jgi:hypothetical protein
MAMQGLPPGCIGRPSSPCTHSSSCRQAFAEQPFILLLLLSKQYYSHMHIFTRVLLLTLSPSSVTAWFLLPVCASYLFLTSPSYLCPPLPSSRSLTNHCYDPYSMQCSRQLACPFPSQSMNARYLCLCSSSTPSAAHHGICYRMLHGHTALVTVNLK